MRALFAFARFVLCCFAFLATLVLVACSPDTETDRPLSVDVIGQQTEDAVIADSLSAGLTALDPAGQLTPGLARSWRVSNDGLSIVFRLNNITHADGSQPTAEDAVRAIDAARKGRSGPLLASLLKGVESASAPVPGIVELRLSTPQPELLELLSVPQLGLMARAPASGTQSAMASGPFLATPAPGAEPATSLQWRPHAEPTDHQHPTRITLMRGNAANAIRRFNHGQSDLVLGGELEGLADARVTARRGTLIVERPRATLLLLVNQNHEHLAQHALRHALQLAINREDLARRLFGTQAAAPVFALSPANIRGYEPPVPDWASLSFASRQLEASQLLTEAHTKQDLPEQLQLNVAITTDAGDTELITAIAGDLAAIGIELKLVRRKPDAHAQAVAKGDFQLALVRHDTLTDSPLPFLLPFACKANPMGACVRDADHLIAESWQAPSFGERLAYLETAERLLAEQVVAISLVQPIGWLLASPRISGIAANRAGRHPLHFIQLTEDRKFIP